jgi:hypothetical protein
MRAISGGARSATADEALLVITMYSTSSWQRDEPRCAAPSLRFHAVLGGDRSGGLQFCHWRLRLSGAAPDAQKRGPQSITRGIVERNMLSHNEIFAFLAAIVLSAASETDLETLSPTKNRDQPLSRRPNRHANRQSDEPY